MVPLLTSGHCCISVTVLLLQACHSCCMAVILLLVLGSHGCNDPDIAKVANVVSRQCNGTIEAYGTEMAAWALK